MFRPLFNICYVDILAIILSLKWCRLQKYYYGFFIYYIMLVPSEYCCRLSLVPHTSRERVMRKMRRSLVMKPTCPSTICGVVMRNRETPLKLVSQVAHVDNFLLLVGDMERYFRRRYFKNWVLLLGFCNIWVV